MQQPAMPLDTEDKLAWCEAWGEEAELAFVARMFRAGLGVSMNPHKVDDPYVHDLLLTVKSDLKSVRTPFFTAGRYGLEPQYAVTLNHKDLQHYREHAYFMVIFDVKWEILQMVGGGQAIQLQPMEGVWLAPLDRIAKAIACGKAPRHAYAHRQDDRQGNAKDSYVLDLRWFTEVVQRGT